MNPESDEDDFPQPIFLPTLSVFNIKQETIMKPQLRLLAVRNSMVDSLRQASDELRDLLTQRQNMHISIQKQLSMIVDCDKQDVYEKLDFITKCNIERRKLEKQKEELDVKIRNVEYELREVSWTLEEFDKKLESMNDLGRVMRAQEPISPTLILSSLGKPKEDGKSNVVEVSKAKP